MALVVVLVMVLVVVSGRVVDEVTDQGQYADVARTRCRH
jgi:hypothetical protein